LDTSLLEQLRNSWKAQPDKPEETLESTYRALHFAAAQVPKSAHDAMRFPLPELDTEAERRLCLLIEMRCSGIPLSYITGRDHFMGIEMLAGPVALIPRAETEILGYETLAISRSLSIKRGILTVMDICTGSGNVILGLAALEPNIKGIGSDLSLEAIEFARKNAMHLGLDDRVKFIQSDLFESFNSEEFFGKIDIITCNPPYVSSQKIKKLDREIFQHEPKLAFDGGPLGYSILRRFIRDAPKFLKPDSFVCFEIGIGQGPLVARMLKNSNLYREIRSLNDSTGKVRGFVAGT